MESTHPAEESAPIAFKAETRQLLDILIHSLYTEREIFLRELISNASDALARLDFELLTNRDVLDPEAERLIRILVDQDEKTLTVEDSGIGMTSDDMVANLGTIAHSGAREFISAAKISGASADELIGQFGVGFYSAFMVAEWIRVTSRSYRQENTASTWFCTGTDTFTVEPATRERRGTSVTLKLKEDALEFLEDRRLREVILKHTDFIPPSSYIKGGPPPSLTEMTTGLGYWVLINAADTLTIYGQFQEDPPAMPKSYDVYVGWNLIGFHSTGQMTAGDYLSALVSAYGVPTWTKMWGFDGSWTAVASNGMMVPGYGYWLAVNADGTIYP